MAAAEAILYTPLLLREKIVLKPESLHSEFEADILAILKRKYEGICSHNGYIKPDSIEIATVSPGHVRSFSLNGDTEYKVTFRAKICSPCNGSVLEARVISINRLGIMAVVDDPDTGAQILEIVVIRGFDGVKVNVADVDRRIDLVQVGHRLRIEVMGKRFQLGDRKITVVGKIVFEDKNANNARSSSTIVDASSTATRPVQDDDELEDVAPDEEAAALLLRAASDDDSGVSSDDDETDEDVDEAFDEDDDNLDDDANKSDDDDA